MGGNRIAPRPRFAGPLVPINIQLDEIENNAIGTRKATLNKARAINAQLSERGTTNEVPKVSVSSEGGKPKEVAKPEVEAQKEAVPISELITTFVKNNTDGIPERVSQDQHAAQVEAAGGVEEKPTASIAGIEKTIRDAQRDSKGDGSNTTEEAGITRPDTKGKLPSSEGSIRNAEVASILGEDRSAGERGVYSTQSGKSE